MNVDRIGAAAGAVWRRLRDRMPEGCAPSELKRGIDGFTGDEVVAGVGWLAREGKIRVENQGRKTRLRLEGHELVDV